MRVLDTDVCIAYLRGREPALARRLRETPLAKLRLCSVVKAELLFGARNSERVDENLEKLRLLFRHVESLPFDDDAAEHYGALRARLWRAGTPIGANDLMIAATCLAADATLVTRNARELSRVTGLRVEQW